ncbi:MAG: ABC transporter permease [Treponemataceae bacterium]|nr:ABC transporter permease [Treponemataceae bacterium]
MRLLLNVLLSSVPLMLASAGALISEYAGVLAVFIDGMINLSAFLTFLFTYFTGNAAAACLLACICTAAVTLLTAWCTEKTKANPFVTGIALNLFSTGFTSVCSSSFFSTKGVLSPAILQGKFSFPQAAFSSLSDQTAFFAFFIPSLLLVLALYPMVKYTKWGLRLVVTGEAPLLLEKKGVNSSFYRSSSWLLAGVFASLAGSILTLRLSSFVPNVSSGRGWIALAAVFLGRRNVFGIIASSLLFTVAGYAADAIQTVAGFSFIPPSILPALPYIAATVVFFIGGEKNNSSKN